MPLIEFQHFLLGHPFRVICFGGGNWSNVILIFHCVEKMREEAFLEFGNTKRLREGGERKWKKAKRVYELEVARFKRQNFSSNADLVLDGAMLFVQLV